MILARVIGTVWATRKDEQLEGLKLQIVEPTDLEGTGQGQFVVAVDAVEAGVGELVLVAQGSSGRQTAETRNKPVDAVIMAIVDDLKVHDPEVLEKDYAARLEVVDERLEKQAEL